MSLERLLLPIYLPRWMHRAVLGLKRAFIPANGLVSFPERRHP